MGDSWMTAIAIGTAAIIMGIFPLMAMAKQKDETANLAAQTALTQTVNESRATGVLEYEDYENLISTLTALGNSYDVAIEVNLTDGNLEKKEGDSSSDKIYYTKYTTQVQEELINNGKIIFNEGDTISMRAYRTNITIFEQLSNYLNRKSGNSTGEKVAEASGMITRTGK